MSMMSTNPYQTRDERRLKIAIKEDWRYAGHTDIPLKKITPETKTIEDGINK